MAKWYDKKLPRWLDDTETVASVADATIGGWVAPRLAIEVWNKKQPPKDFNDRLKRVVISHLAAGLINEAVFGKMKSLHDSDPRSCNMHLMNGATIHVDVFWELIREYRKKDRAGR